MKSLIRGMIADLAEENNIEEWQLKDVVIDLAVEFRKEVRGE